MTLYRNQSISPEKLLAVAANILVGAFFDTSRALAKRRYQALEKGHKVFLLNIAMEDRSELAVDIALDVTELRNKLNFSALRDVIGQLLGAVSKALNEKQTLPIFTNEDGGRWGYLIPAVYSGPERDDVLILGLDARQRGKLTLELMFIDPAQFQAPAANIS